MFPDCHLVTILIGTLQMLVEQKKLKRQSEILMQTCSSSQAALEALSQVTDLTSRLEAQRLEHQNQVIFLHSVNKT